MSVTVGGGSLRGARGAAGITNSDRPLVCASDRSLESSNFLSISCRRVSCAAEGDAAGVSSVPTIAMTGNASTATASTMTTSAACPARDIRDQSTPSET
ncbi:MAG: hypothetical protein IT434_17340 [Phycisphaerales bacterium]|nr:hypothetical protein [Phycisphaerales bacterium]